MRRLTIIGTLVTGLIAGLGLVGAPADAATAARSRVKVIVTSVSGERIMVIEGLMRCRTKRRDADVECAEMQWRELNRARFQHSVKVRKTRTAGFVFLGERNFRMRVLVNGVERVDRKAADFSGFYILGFMYMGTGAIVLI